MNTELDKLLRKELGLGESESPQRIYHTRDTRLPQFEFEWHTSVQKVYRIDLPGSWIDDHWVLAPVGSQANGRCIAEHCLTHGMFLGFVQTFCRGYLLAIQHRNSGTLNTYAPERVISKDTDPCPIR